MGSVTKLLGELTGFAIGLADFRIPKSSRGNERRPDRRIELDFKAVSQNRIRERFGQLQTLLEVGDRLGVGRALQCAYARRQPILNGLLVHQRSGIMMRQQLRLGLHQTW